MFKAINNWALRKSMGSVGKLWGHSLLTTLSSRGRGHLVSVRWVRYRGRSVSEFLKAIRPQMTLSEKFAVFWITWIDKVWR